MSIMECHSRILGVAPEDLVVYFLITQNSQCLSLGIKASYQISSSRQGSRRICFGRKHVSHDVSPILFVVNSDMLGGGFEYFFIFTPTWENDLILRILFRWVETTNQMLFVVNSDI